MGSLLDIPVQLLLVLSAALDGGGTAREVATAMPATPVAAIAAGDRANPYRFGSEAFFDALAGLRADQRFATYGGRVFRTSSGVAYVPTVSEARKVLALRTEPVIARHVAQRYAAANALALAQRLGRPPRIADLYLAHRVGLRLAVDFNERLAQRPSALAAIELPDLDEAAPELLFAGERATTLADIAAQLDNVTGAAARRHGIANEKAPEVSATVLAASKTSAPSLPGEASGQVMGWRVEIRPRRSATGGGAVR